MGLNENKNLSKTNNIPDATNILYGSLIQTLYDLIIIEGIKC